MSRVEPCPNDNEREKSIRPAKQGFVDGIEPSVRSAYSVPYTAPSANPHWAHKGLQLLGDQEEAI